MELRKTKMDNKMFKIMILLLTTALLTLQATPLLKTGQTKSYDTDGNVVTDGSIEDDGYYQAGATRSYSRSDIGVVTDNVTGLEWQDDVASVSKKWTNDNNSSDTAFTYCSNLSLDGGDWRLPTIKELQTILDNGVHRPSISSVFQKVTSKYYWSSTTNASYTSDAWCVGFNSGSTGADGKTYSSLYVRCVRGGQ